MYKLTKEFLESPIKDVQYIETIPGKCVHCIITVKNGYTFQGDAGVIDPKNFRFEIGKKVAYDNAFEKMWVVFGYQVQDQFYKQEVISYEDRIKMDIDERNNKILILSAPTEFGLGDLASKEIELLKALRHVNEERLYRLRQLVHQLENS